MLTRPALDALTDQAFAATGDMREDQPPFVAADAALAAAALAEQFRGSEAVAARVVMTVAMNLAVLLGRYSDFPGGLELVPVVLALAAERVIREAGAT